MNNALFTFARPENEPSMSYAPGCPERELLKEAIREIESETAEIPLVINGEFVRTGNTGSVVMPHDHGHKLAVYHKAGAEEMERAIAAANAAHESWSNMPWTERASIVLKIAELIDKKYRYILNAATMMGQSKSVWQAEIEAASETIDYFRFGVHCMNELYGDQPASEEGVINRLEYRPLEGFVYAISPFNFTALAANLPMAPVMMGNTVVWKPATTSLLSSWYLMKIFMEAGVPAGVLNFMPGPGSVGSGVVLKSKDLAGILHRLDTGLQRPLEGRRRESLPLPLISEARRRDGRQRFCLRPRVGGYKGRRHGDGQGRFRVSGAEVLRDLPRLYPREPLG